MGIQERLGRKFFVSSAPSPSIAAARKYCPFYGRNQTLALDLRCRVHSIFCYFIVNLVSFHPTMAMKHRLEDDEIERQLKCKICDVGLCILGCFEEYHTKAGFS
jgi:hypothetical protein